MSRCWHTEQYTQYTSTQPNRSNRYPRIVYPLRNPHILSNLISINLPYTSANYHGRWLHVAPSIFFCFIGRVSRCTGPRWRAPRCCRMPERCFSSVWPLGGPNPGGPGFGSGHRPVYPYWASGMVWVSLYDFTHLYHPEKGYERLLGGRMAHLSWRTLSQWLRSVSPVRGELDLTVPDLLRNLFPVDL